MLSTLTHSLLVLLALIARETPSRMGYDVHITRAQDWTESRDHPITLSEWKAYLRSDGEMRLDNRAQATTSSGETITTESPGLRCGLRGSRTASAVGTLGFPMTMAQSP